MQRKRSVSRTRTYRSWQAMKDRCLNPKALKYARYGGRGITVCPRWLESFENFKVDMGIRPWRKTLGRRDNNGNYTPDNCVWSGYSAQNRNREPYHHKVKRDYSYLRGIKRNHGKWCV